VARAGASRPARRKVYDSTGGVSIGGYGEWLFSDLQGRDDDVADALRTILYVGHRFDDAWLLNTELEFEHGTTEDASGTTSSEGSVSVEFAYLEHVVSDELAVRGGVLLVPMGLVNERHEPTTFPTARRSITESRILPTTWRELGLGVLGERDGVSWKLFVVNGLEGERFDEGGLRSGRQKGNRADFDDPAVVARVDVNVADGARPRGLVLLRQLQPGRLRVRPHDTDHRGPTPSIAAAPGSRAGSTRPRCSTTRTTSSRRPARRSATS
jgi:hypothetical protein